MLWLVVIFVGGKRLLALLRFRYSLLFGHLDFIYGKDYQEGCPESEYI